MKNAIVQKAEPTPAAGGVVVWSPNEVAKIRSDLFGRKNGGAGFDPDIAERSIQAICELSGLPREELLSRHRDERRALARLICYWLVVRVANASFTEAARIFGRNHGAIVSGVARVDGFCDVRPAFAAALQKLSEKIAQ